MQHGKAESTQSCMAIVASPPTTNAESTTVAISVRLPRAASHAQALDRGAADILSYATTSSTDGAGAQEFELLWTT
jgi:hypothetical protein